MSVRVSKSFFKIISSFFFDFEFQRLFAFSFYPVHARKRALGDEATSLGQNTSSLTLPSLAFCLCSNESYSWHRLVSLHEKDIFRFSDMHSQVARCRRRTDCIRSDGGLGSTFPPSTLWFVFPGIVFPVYSFVAVRAGFYPNVGN